MIGAIGKAFSKVARVGPGMMAGGGAAAGGIYGALSDNTSVLSGALTGAALGAGAWGAAKMGGKSLRMYSNRMGYGQTRGRALSAVMEDLGARSKGFFGARLGSNRAVNPVASSVKATRNPPPVPQPGTARNPIDMTKQAEYIPTTQEVVKDALRSGTPSQRAVRDALSASRPGAVKQGQLQRLMNNPRTSGLR